GRGFRSCDRLRTLRASEADGRHEQLSFPPLENKRSAPNRDIVPMPKARPLQRAVIEEDWLGGLASFDFAFVTDRSNNRMVFRDLGIIEQINVRARRRANVHYIFEEHKIPAGERSIGPSKPVL